MYPMVTTLTGPNDFMRDAEMRTLVGSFVGEHGDMAVEKLDGEEAPFERMQEALQSLPFLAARKLVVLRAPSANKQFAEAAEDLLADVAETTDVLIVEPKLDRRLSYYKLLKKATDFREFGELDAIALAKWAHAYVAGQGGKLSLADARVLIDRVGTDQQMLQNELDKLLAYAPEITGATIGLLTEPLPQSTIFALLDAAFSGDRLRAMTLYREQRMLKVEPQAIIGLLGWQLHIIALVKAAGTRGADDIAREAKLSPFVVRKSQTMARSLGLAQIKKLIAELLFLDTRIKTANVDADEAVQQYILQLAD